jgi:hypothetical protein
MPEEGDDPLPQEEPQEETEAKETKQRQKRRKKRRRFLLSPSNFLSSWLFIWIARLVSRIRCTSDPRSIHLCLAPSETCSVCGDALAAAWKVQVETRGQNASLFSALKSAFGWRYVALSLWKFLWIFFTWVGAFWVLKTLIALQDSPSPSTLYGHLYAALLFLTSFLGSLCFHQLGLQSTRIGIQVLHTLRRG